MSNPLPGRCDARDRIGWLHTGEDPGAGRRGVAPLQFGDAAIDSIGCPEPWTALVEVIRSGEAQYSIVASRLEIAAGGLGIGAVTD